MNLNRFAEGLPDWQEGMPMARCKECGGEIYEGARIYIISKCIYCDNCVESYFVEDALEEVI